MRRDLGPCLLALVAVALIIGGCKRASVAVYDVPKEKTPAPSSIAATAPSSPTEKGWIQWTKPPAWTELAPTAFRKGNFVYEGDNEKIVEITVSSFPGNVGGTLANVNRWRGQAGLPSISNDALQAALTEVTVDGHDGQIVNILPESSNPDDVQIVAAIFLYQGESWFFKMSGPQQLVSSQKATFDAFIDSLQFTNAASKNGSDASEDTEEPVLAFDPPEGWVESEGSSMRIASYEVALDGFEPADFSITRFPGDAGGITANVNRWRQQIGLRPWKDSQVSSNRESLEVGNLDFALFDLKPQNDADKERVKERILAAILKFDDESYFFKLRGDVFLVETQRTKFRQLIQSSRFESSNQQNRYMKPFIKFFSSFELAISCMVLGLILTFIGTLDQVNLGIHGAVEHYFYSFFVYWNVPGSDIAIPYFPGGYTIGLTLLVNLITALLVRFRYSWKKSGVLMVHIGVITLLIGELISSMMQVDSAMIIDEGSSSNFSEDRQIIELAIIDYSASTETNRVYAFPQEMLETMQDCRHEALPFTIGVNQFMANSVIQRRDENTPSKSLIANRGIGLNTYAQEIPKTGKMDDVNRTSAILTIFDDKGEVVGTWLASLGFPPQEFTFQGKEYSLEIRRKRYYYPFEIKLEDFSHDRYLGTNIPMNFSSEIELTHPERGEKREFLIYMNHPLRYDGLTFFQSGFANEDTTTILQVVSNPGRHLPYLSCGLIFAGLTVQFLIGLISFAGRRQKKS